MNFSIGSRTTERIGTWSYRTVVAGCVAMVLLALVIVFTGCSTVSTAWHDLVGSPADNAQQAAAEVVQAEVKVDTAKDALVDDAHTKVVLAELLSRYIAEQSKTVDALRTTLSGAKADLDTARGSLPPDQLVDLRQVVEQLRSDNAETVAVAQLAVSALETNSGKHAELLTTALGEVAIQRTRADKADAAALDWARERDATARKWDRLWLWVWIVAGLWLAAQLLPLAAKLIPQLAPVATVLSAIVAPVGTRALSQAKGLGRDASAALHNVMATVAEKAPALVAEVAAIRNEWITAADGTAAAHAEALREAQQI